MWENLEAEPRNFSELPWSSRDLWPIKKQCGQWCKISGKFISFCIQSWCRKYRKPAVYLCWWIFNIKGEVFLQKNQNFWLTLKEENGFNENIHIFIYCDVPFKSWLKILIKSKCPWLLMASLNSCSTHFLLEVRWGPCLLMARLNSCSIAVFETPDNQLLE